MHDYAKAAECFQASVARDPRSVMAHQNYAGGYDPSSYTPSRWELENAGELLIYDNLIQLGENFYHQGRYEDTFRCYQAALDHQDTLAQKMVDSRRRWCSGSRPEVAISSPICRSGCWAMSG